MRLSTLVAGTLVLGAVSSSAFGAAWTTPSGTAPGGKFSFSNGGDDAGLFGSPTVVADGFLFFPSNFFAESSNGVAKTTRDRMYVTIDLPRVGEAIDKIRLTEVGDYSILGTGSVKASGLLTVTVLESTNPAVPVMTVLRNTLNTTPSFPVSTTTSADGEWTGELLVDIPDGVTSVQVVLNNILQATSGAGSTSFIEKKNAGVEITLIIPEPATAAVLLGGSGLMLLRRRKA